MNLQVCGVFHRAIELIGRRWTGAIISMMFKGAERFCEFREAIPGISDRLLTERLKELEEARIVLREVGDSRPPSVTYRLTDKGRSLAPVLDGITDWASAWEGEV
ncbi:MAG: helix-turn-helix domain-containing protein [Spirochaetota bacterium]